MSERIQWFNWEEAPWFLKAMVLVGIIGLLACTGALSFGLNVALTAGAAAFGSIA